MFGLILLVFKVYSTKSVSGISKNSIICYTILFFPKVLTLTFYEGYLPYDSTGDFFYRLAEWISFFCSLATLYFFTKFKHTYTWDLDTFKWYYFAFPCLILAFLFHPCLNRIFYADIPWIFSVFLESVAMFP